jgi:hypothetical protein
MPGMGMGYIFKSNGSLEVVTKTDDGYVPTPGMDGTWTVSGSDLKITLSGVPTQMPYSVSGNTLTLGGVPYTKTQIGTAGNNGGGNPGDFTPTGGEVVLGANEAWVTEEDGEKFACIFKSPNQFWEAIYYEGRGGVWIGGQVGNWSKSGTSLTVTYTGEAPVTAPYSVSGNNLKISFTEDGESYLVSFTKEAGVVVQAQDTRLVLPEGYAWTTVPDRSINNMSTGYIYNNNGTYFGIYNQNVNNQEWRVSTSVGGGSGTYTADGAILSRNNWDGDPYIISGDSLKFSGSFYLVTPNVNVDVN